MTNLSRLFLLLKQLFMSFILFNYDEMKLDWYILKVNVLYPAELLEWRKTWLDAEPAEFFDGYKSQFD
jgi:hypothetical protein